MNPRERPRKSPEKLIDVDYRSRQGRRYVKGVGRLPGRVLRQQSLDGAMRGYFREQIGTQEQQAEIVKKFKKKPPVFDKINDSLKNLRAK